MAFLIDFVIGMAYLVDIRPHADPQKAASNSVDDCSCGCDGKFNLDGAPLHEESGGVVDHISEGGECYLPLLRIGNFGDK